MVCGIRRYVMFPELKEQQTRAKADAKKDAAERAERERQAREAEEKAEREARLAEVRAAPRRSESGAVTVNTTRIHRVGS